MAWCSFYGLGLSAADLPPARHPLAAARADVHLQVRRGEAGGRGARPHERLWYESAWVDPASGEASLSVFRSEPDGSFRLRFPDGVEFLADRAGRLVRATLPPTSTRDDLNVYLTGPVAGFLLRIRGVVALHASAVVVGGRAVAFVGPAGAGKSTTAAAFSAASHAVVTEDIAALADAREGILVQPGYPYVMLRPDSVAALFGSHDALPPVTPGWEKRRLALDDEARFAPGPLPLAAVYLLAEDGGGPRVEPLAAREAIVGLLGNVYGSRLFHEELRLTELDLIRRVAASLPVRRAVRGRHPQGVTALREVVLEDLERPGAAPRATPAA